MPHTPNTHDSVEVLISDDRLIASVQIDAATAPHGVDVADIISTLDAAGVVGVRDQSILHYATPKGKLLARAPLVVLRGVASVAGSAATLTFAEGCGAGSQVTRDAAFGRVDGGGPGSPGLDVFNKSIQPRRPRDAFSLGLGVVVDEQGWLRAMTDGRLTVHPDGTVAVLAKFTVAGDLSSTTLARHLPPVASHATDDLARPRVTGEWPGDLDVTGSVRDSLSLDVAGSLSVAGAIDAERIEVGEDLLSAAGLLGAGLTATRGHYTAARDITARFATGARLDSGRDIHINADLMHCRIVCGGKLIVSERIHGCVVVATGGVTCHAVSASAQQPTVLEAGSDPVLRSMAAITLPDIDDHLQKVQHSKLTIAPLLARKDSLTPAQRQHAVRLIRETTRLEQIIADATAPLRARYQLVQTTSVAEIAVHDVLQAGVVVRFPGLEAVIPTTFRGPLTIVPERSPGDPRVLIIDRRTKSSHAIPARQIGDPITFQLHKVMAKIA